MRGPGGARAGHHPSCEAVSLLNEPSCNLAQVLRLALKPYVPDFTTAFEHFCIHPGGKAVIEEVSKQLKLRPEQSLPMLVPFERYGNTSSSSTWCAAPLWSSAYKVEP